MAHAIMFRDDDPLLVRLRDVCLALPGAAEKVSHGRPNWYTTKVFASFGGKIRGDHADPTLDRALLFLPDPEDAVALEQDRRIVVPAYVGHRGWRALPLDVGEPDWTEVAELVEASYRQLASRSLVARLDGRG